MFEEFNDEASTRSDKASAGAITRWKRDDILRMNKTLQKAYREAIPAKLDMSLEKARAELQRLTQAGSFQEYAKRSARRAGTLRDAGHAEQARKALLLDTGLGVAVPAIMEIAGVIVDLQSEAKAAEERIARRTELQANVDKVARGLADKTWRLWHDEGLPAALESALVEAKCDAISRAEALALQHKLATETRDPVRTVLDRDA